MTGMHSFSLSPADLQRVGGGLHRPECVLTTACGDLYVSDERGGVTRIAPDGSTTLFAGQTEQGQPLAANGFAMLADGSFLVAPLVGGGVYRLHRNGRSELFLAEANGLALPCPNFVLLDDRERVWICCLTQRDRTSLTSYSREQRDGCIVLVDRQGARIVADGIGFPNEVRIDPSGRWLYTVETLAARLLRYPLRPDGSLGPCEVVAAFDESNVLDGFTLDAEGGAWITALVSNRLWYVAPEGDVRLLIEDADAEQLERLAQLQRTSGVTRAILYEERGSTLRNISSVAFGGADLQTVYLGSLMGQQILSFRAPVAGMRPAHWHFGPFD
jgi:SMP-30/Gluconolactonase/LRE-like region